LAAGVDITTPRVGPAPHPIVVAAIASNGRSFLTVWNGPVGGRNALYASASGSDGRPTTVESVHVANLGDGSLVAVLPIGDDYAIFARESGRSSMLRVSKDGHLQARISFDFDLADMAWNGQRFLGVERTTPTSNVKVSLFDLDGHVLARRDFAASPVISSAVVAAGSEFLIVTSSTGGGGGITAYRLSNDGSVVSSTAIVSGTVSSSVRAVSRGSDVFAVWARNGQIETVLLRGGSVIHPPAIATSAPVPSPLAVVTTDGYAVLWNELDHFEMVRFTPSGDRVDPVALGMGLGRVLDGAAVGNLVEVIFSRDVLPLAAGWFRSDDAVPRPTTASIANLRSRQTGPAVASDGQQFLASWIDETGIERAAMAAHFARHSPPLDGTGIPLGLIETAAQFPPMRTAVAFGGGRYLVVWPDGKQLNGTFVPQVGGPPEPPFVIRNKDVRDPAVVWSGSEFFVVWSEGRLFGARVSAAGVVADAQKISPDLPQHPNGMADSSPDVAWNGTEYLATWLVTPNAAVICTCTPPPPSEVRAARVSLSGAPIDTGATVVLNGSPRGVHAASSGDSFLLTIDNGAGIDTVVVRTNLGDTRSLLTPGFLFWPVGPSRPVSDVTFDGSTFVVASHYEDAEAGWLATAHFLRGGELATVFLERVDDAASSLERSFDSVAIAAGALGAAVVSSEGPPGEPQRLKAFFDAEMPFAGAPPPTPHGVMATNTYGLLEISWLPVEGAAGYFVEVFAGTWLVSSPPTRETHLTLPGLGGFYSAVRVSAYNGNGVSAPSDSSSIVSRTPRRRSARH
jgi:hypothetical protein